jgi:hypothetical protein
MINFKFEISSLPPYPAVLKFEISEDGACSVLNRIPNVYTERVTRKFVKSVPYYFHTLN